MRFAALIAVLLPAAVSLPAQIIEFESSGLHYKALTKNGVTIMVAQLPTHVREYAILQVSVSNGSPTSWTVRPEDFRFIGDNGITIQAPPAKAVVESFLERAGRSDVMKLVTAYESALNGNSQMHSTNGYEARRQNAQAELGSTRLKAAAAASAIAFVSTKLAPGQSTDGAVFYPNAGKPLGSGKLVVSAAADVFEFPINDDLAQRREPR
jgi:hypothetical protein